METSLMGNKTWTQILSTINFGEAAVMGPDLMQLEYSTYYII